MRSSLRRGPGRAKSAWGTFLGAFWGLGLAACSSDVATPPAAASSAAPTASNATSARAPAASGSTAPSPAAAGTNKRARDLLTAARTLEHDEKWKDATAKLKEARGLAPDDVVILAELGWSALHSDDLATSKDASEKALAIAKEPRQRASVLYNLGRVLEAQNDKEGALARYQESLALRPSKAIEERVASLGGKAPEPPKSEPLPCQKVYANTADLCSCLLPNPAPAGATCATDPNAPKLPSGDLEVVRTSTATEGETALYLVANAGGGITPVADIGRDYHPDAFGLDSSIKILSLTEQTLGQRIAELRTEQLDTSTNAGGADVATLRVVRSTVCVLRTASSPTKCPLVVPIDTEDKRVFATDTSGLTPEQKTYVEAHQKEARDVEVHLTLKLSAKGYAEVGFGKGDKSAVPSGILGRHELF
ncbi:MAG: tetratricopeptide repeat protein [Polyangiaceae bacterium]